MSKKNKKLISIFIIIATILLVLNLIGFLISRTNSDKYHNKFDIVIDNIYNTVEEMINDNDEIKSGNLRINTNEIKNIENEYYRSDFFNALSGNNLDLTFRIDTNNKILQTEYLTNYSKESPINIKVNYQDYYKYAYVLGNYDKYVKKQIDNNEINNMFETLTLDKNYLKIFEGILDIAKKGHSQFRSSYKQSIDIEGEEAEFDTVNIEFNEDVISYLNEYRNDVVINSNEFKKAYSLKVRKEFNYDEFLKYLSNKNIEVEFYLDNNNFNGITIITTDNDIYNRYMIYTKNYQDYIIDCIIDGFIVSGKLTLDKIITLNLEIPIYDIDKLNISLTLEIKDEEKIEKLEITDYYDFSEVIYDKEITVYENMMKRREMRNFKYFVDLYNIDIP